MTCVLLRFRVPRTDTYGDPATSRQVVPKVLRALQDAQRSIRFTRAHAADYGINPHKIGVIGFSARGYLVAQTSNILEPTYTAVDDVDKVSSRPDFAIAAYPGHLCREKGRFDQTDDICNSTMYADRLGSAVVPAEVHLFAKGNHAFALRHVGHPVEMWPSLAEKWLKEMSFL